MQLSQLIKEVLGNATEYDTIRRYVAIGIGDHKEAGEENAGEEDEDQEDEEDGEDGEEGGKNGDGGDSDVGGSDDNDVAGEEAEGEKEVDEITQSGEQSGEQNDAQGPLLDEDARCGDDILGEGIEAVLWTLTECIREEAGQLEQQLEQQMEQQARARRAPEKTKKMRNEEHGDGDMKDDMWSSTSDGDGSTSKGEEDGNTTDSEYEHRDNDDDDDDDDDDNGGDDDVDLLGDTLFDSEPPASAHHPMLRKGSVALYVNDGDKLIDGVCRTVQLQEFEKNLFRHLIKSDRLWAHKMAHPVVVSQAPETVTIVRRGTSIRRGTSMKGPARQRRGSAVRICTTR